MNDPQKTFSTKDGRTAYLRPLQRTDVELMIHFINDVSAENTFLQFAGEQVTLEDEQRYVDSELELIGTENAVKLLCFIDGKLAGIADVHRKVATRSRKLHIGTFGLIIAREFRGQGIGEALMRATIKEAATHLPGLRMIYLECFATNAPALTLYKKLGFTEVGRVPGGLRHNDQFVDEVIMVHNL